MSALTGLTIVVQTIGQSIPGNLSYFLHISLPFRFILYSKPFEKVHIYCTYLEGVYILEEKNRGKLGFTLKERVAAGRSSSVSLAFDPAKCPEDRADYCMGCSFVIDLLIGYWD